MIDAIRDYFNETYDELVLADGWEDCIVGVADVWSTDGQRPQRVIYSADLIAVKLISDGMTYDEAVDYIEFNIVGAYVGPLTPVFVWELPPDVRKTQVKNVVPL